MPEQETEWTAEMVYALPDDGRRYEVLDGTLFVTTSVTLDHQRAIGALLATLSPVADAAGIGRLLMGPADIEFSPTRLVKPDVFVVPLVSGRPPREWSEVKALLLAVEVTEPETARADRVEKRRIYQSERVPEYWIVDLDARLVERWRPGDDRPEVLGQRLSWQPRPDVEPLEIDLEAFFAEVLD